MLTNIYNLPAPFVDAAKSEYTPTPKRYSVTTCLKGTKEAILQRRHYDEIDEDVSDRIWSILGQATHKILEESQETASQFKEVRVEVDMPDGYTLSGIIDLFDGEHGLVVDYKTATVWKHIFKDWNDYRTQILCYCWALRKMGFEADKGEIVAIYRDYAKSKAKTEPDYPPHQVGVVHYDFTDEDFTTIECWLEAKFRRFQAAEQMEDDEIPPCSELERWHQPDKWAAKKKGNKKATKLFENEAEADWWVTSMNEEAGKQLYELEFRPGADKKCDEYCAVKQFCNYYKERSCSVQEPTSTE